MTPQQRLHKKRLNRKRKVLQKNPDYKRAVLSSALGEANKHVESRKELLFEQSFRGKLVRGFLKLTRKNLYK